MNTTTQTKPRTEFAQAQGQPPAKAVHPLAAFKEEMDKRTEQLKHALPPHIPVERFMRVVLTALQNNPKLLACTQQSLWNSCLKAAQDGLLPDGREGAIVPYGENEDGQKKADNATWMPMIAGLRKKARNSGEIRDWYVEVVYGGDHYVYQKGDDPKCEHRPVPPSQRTKGLPHQGIIAAYSIAIYKDGSRSVPEWMWIEEIEGVRSKSKAKKGPWSDAIFYPEMCKKTVARRHSKVLPSSTDLDDLMRRDDDLYDFSDRDDAPETLQQTTQRRLTSVGGTLDAFAGDGDVIDADATEATTVPSDQPESGQQSQAAETAKPAEVTETAKAAETTAKVSEEPKWQLGQQPTTSTQYVDYVRAYFKEVSDPAKRKEWLGSQGERKKRGECKVTKEDWQTCQQLIAAKAAAAETAPDPDQDPEAYLEFLRGQVKGAKSKQDLTALRENFVKPLEPKLFPPDMDAINAIFAEAEKALP